MGQWLLLYEVAASRAATEDQGYASADFSGPSGIAFAVDPNRLRNLAMGWIIFIALLLLYVLGLLVFHASGAVHILPFVAIAVIVTDWVLKRKYRGRS